MATRRQRSHRLSRDDGFAHGGLGRDRLEGRDESAAVVDRDDAASGDRPGERDHPCCRGRDHAGGVGRGDIDTAMAGAVLVRRRDEGFDDAERVHRPPPAGQSLRLVVHSTCRAAEGNDDDQAQQRRRRERTDASTGGCRGRQDEHGPIVASRDGCAYADG
tara:strand:- start:51110 stop:51592 length:483 start_codon:yes stop_codon:yes gene_type:complete